MNKKTIISIKNLVKKYKKLTAVNNISLDIYKNEIFGFLGPNGAGKTTTLEIIETLNKKTSGTVLVGGYSVDNEANKIKSIIGVQLQSSGFYPKLKLTETLELFAGLYDVKIDPMKLLKMVNLESKAGAKVKELSGGQKQRFSIATTIVHKPAIVFLDEPSTGLDPQARRNLWELIQTINNGGTTIVLTTHYMDEAELLCDRVAIMDEGNILNIDTPKKLINDLLGRGFKKQIINTGANLEDVFIDLTGKELKE